MKIAYLVVALIFFGNFGFADVCQNANPLSTSSPYEGAVTCGAGVIQNITVSGSLALNGTTVEGNLSVNGVLQANQASIKDGANINGNAYFVGSTVNGDINSNGAVYVQKKTIVRGNINSSTGQVSVDSSSRVLGKTKSVPGV